MMNAIAEMVSSLGYDVFLWENAEFFGTQYQLVQVNPMGTWIVINDGTTIVVGAKLSVVTWKVDGGVTLDMADPVNTTEKLGEILKTFE